MKRNVLTPKIVPREIPYFFSGVIIFTGRFNGVNISQYIKYGVAGIWALYYLGIVLVNRRNSRQRNEKRRDIRFHFKLMIVPFIYFAGYTILIWLYRRTAELGNYTRLGSTVLYLMIAWGFAACGYYLFGRKTINILFWSGVVSYTLGSVIPLIMTYGIGEIGAYLASTITGNNSAASYMMEVHDLTFAMGLFFLYYLFVEDNKIRGHHKRIIISILLILLGLKRIEILALGVAIASYLIALRRGKTMKGRSLFFFMVFSVMSLSFVYIISSGALAAIAARFGINFMGRLGYYAYAKDFYSFSPFFLGNGYTYFSRYWGSLYSSGFRIDGYGIAASLHSDILVMYIEIGFVGMLVWIYYCFRIKTVKLNKAYGVIVSEYYLLSTIFMFILYLTDNTSTYFLTQMIYFIIPLSIGKALGVNTFLSNSASNSNLRGEI